AGTGPGDTVLVRIPLLCVTRHGTRGRFAAAIDPARGDTPGEVQEVTLSDDTTSGYLLRVRLRDGSEEIYTYDPVGKERIVEGMRTGARRLGMRGEGGGRVKVLGEAQGGWGAGVRGGGSGGRRVGGSEGVSPAAGRLAWPGRKPGARVRAATSAGA